MKMINLIKSVIFFFFFFLNLVFFNGFIFEILIVTIFLLKWALMREFVLGTCFLEILLQDETVTYRVASALVSQF